MIILGVESSCDETAWAVVEDGRKVRASLVVSQVARHSPFGGVVPEIAAREHVATLVPLLAKTLAEAGLGLDAMDAIAVTDRPGLIASLLAGIAAAQALGLALDLPVIGVNHIEAHLVAPFLAEDRDPEYPFVSLVVSGGHTHLFRSRGPRDHRLLGATLDDAAGEAFDKVANLLGLGYPGGPAIQKAARDGDPKRIAFKRPLLARDSLDFSFSGLKTAVLYRCFRRGDDGRYTRDLLPEFEAADVAAAFQAAVVDVCGEKLRRAVAATGVERVSVGGGVACNGPLRERLRDLADRHGWELLLTPPSFCTDNAAMVAARGAQLLRLLPPAELRPGAAARATWPREAS